jgi:hypothetical protein
MHEDALTYHIKNLVRLQQEAYVAHLLSQERFADKRRLALYEHQVFSQHGQDGIIGEIFRRIGTDTRMFVEIGAGHGLENNTVFLLSQGWRGFWVEGAAEYSQTITRLFRRAFDDKKLFLLCGVATRENIAGVLQEYGVPTEFDLLSLDIDQNTYWIWDGLRHLRPRAVVAEYNATYPPGLDWKVAYHPDRTWDQTSYFGASLKAYELLGKELGYCLVGCDLSGTDAFFVRQDLCGDHFLAPYDAETHYEPARSYLLRRNGPPRGAGEFD